MRVFLLLIPACAVSGASAQIAVPLFKRLTPAAAFVQTAEKLNSSSSTTASTPAFSSATATGNAIICVVFQPKTQTVSGVTDSLSNTYSLAVSLSAASCDGATATAIYYATGISGGTGMKVTATFNGSASTSGISCHEFANLATSPFDNAGSSTTGTSSTTINGGPAINNNAKELVLAYVVSFQAPSAGSGFTSISAINGNLIEYKFTLAPGSSPVTASVSPASCNDVIWSSFLSK